MELGKLVDFVILSENLFEVEAAAIREVAVLETWLVRIRYFDFEQK